MCGCAERKKTFVFTQGDRMRAQLAAELAVYEYEFKRWPIPLAPFKN